MKTNKTLFTSFALLMLLVCVGTLFAGCGEKISRIDIISGMPESVYLNVQPDFSSVQARVYYDNNTNKVVGYNDLTFSAIDTSTLGKKEVVITLKGSDYEGITVEINVIEVPVVSNLESLASPLLTARAKSDFINQSNNLVAGSDNEYDLQVVATDVNGDETTDFDMSVKMSVKEGSAYTLLENEDYYTYNQDTRKIQFKSTANDKNFKIVASADGCDDLEFIVDVVSGYNVYEAKDLCVIENKGIHNWDIFKQNTKYEGVTTSAVILQKDISVTDNDIPSEFFYSETEAQAVPSGLTNKTIVGSFKDGDGNGTGGNGRAIYHREIASDETFNFYGNYFTVNYSQLTKCVVESGHVSGVKYDHSEGSHEGETLITTHAAFLKFDGVSATSQVNVNDANFIGNAQRSSCAENSGGIMVAKLHCLKGNIKNCNYSNSFIGFMFEANCEYYDNVSYCLEDTQGSECFNTLIYVWGVKNVLIKGGSYTSAGGPVMIVDHNDNNQTTGEGGYPSDIKIIGAKLESFVTGYEPWFVSYGATALMTGVIAADGAYFTPLGATFLKNKEGVSNLLNLKVVYKSASAEGLTSSVVRGQVKYYNNQEEYENDTGYGLDMTTYSAVASALSDPIMQNSYNGKIRDGTNYDYATVNSAENSVTNINLYLNNGMGAMFELYQKAN